MAELDIRGVTVKFPFKPYEVQKHYMEKVIECLQNSENGVLESPTGTGKTLCLLCSSLGWLKFKKDQVGEEVKVRLLLENSVKLNASKNGSEEAPKGLETPGLTWMKNRIIYASRTHSQISQAMQELKRTAYNDVRVSVLGSRDQLCVHPEVSKEPNTTNKIHMCQAKVKAGNCEYFNKTEKAQDDAIFNHGILDIEDLVKAGQKKKCCPYFLSRELKEKADIVFMPYNYLLDPRSRKAQKIILHNNVILLDEAHNVEKTCEEAASLQISSTDVALCIDDITSVMQDMAKNLDNQVELSIESIGAEKKDFTAEDLVLFKTMFLELEKAVDSIEIKNRIEGEVFGGSYIFELLKKADIHYGNEHVVSEKLDKIILYLSTTSTSAFSRKGQGLQKFMDLLKVAFFGGVRHRSKVEECYKVHVQFEEVKKSYKNSGWEVKKAPRKNEGKVISYWCFSPAFGMQNLADQGTRSVILTSGTLSPMKPFISEIGIPINVTLENPHIVSGDQLCVRVLSKGPDSHVLNSSYNTRNDPQYVASLGRTIFNFSNIIPHGLLIFFPSYPILSKCREDWQASGLWAKISNKKAIFVEPQSKHNFANIMNEFYAKINDPSLKGAIFMAVCRGKVSEGLDFANNNGRAVLITGLPFPPLKDPRVVLKKKYLDENAAKRKDGLTGQYWYQLEALRAVNQAMGRIIRHKGDYGAIILCDVRFENPSNKSQLSTWLRPHLKVFPDFASATKDLRDFFVYARKVFPEVQAAAKPEPTSATTAAFDASGSRRCSKNAQRSEAQSATVDNGASFDISYYSQSKKDSEGKKSPQSDSLIQLLHNYKSKKPMINFHICSETPAAISASPVNVPVPKPKFNKRKYKMVELNYKDEPSCSTSIESVENNEKVAKIDKESCSDKKELGKAYLKDVKKSLNETDFPLFKTMITNYRKHSNYEELMQSLTKLFPLEGSNSHLFEGFRNFIRKEHKYAFENHILTLKKKFVTKFDQSNAIPFNCT